MPIMPGVIEALGEFNESGHGIRAELLQSKGGIIEIRFSGLLCRNADGRHEFPAFRELLESKLLKRVSTREATLTGPEEHRVVYAIGEDSPAGTILNILGRYDEGVQAPGGEFED